MSKPDRLIFEEGLIAEALKIGKMFENKIPADGHLSMTYFPDGHVDVFVSTDSKKPSFVANAWRSATGKIYQGEL